MSQHQLAALFSFFVACFAVAGISRIASHKGIASGWYDSLKLPAWRPPNWVFAPVWMTLYTCMALAAFMVWRTGVLLPRTVPLLLFSIQLLLNGLWSWLFFYLRRPDLAFFEIVLLWLTVVATTWSFFEHSTLAGILMLPYAAWVLFAAVLNYQIWRDNPAMG